MPVTASADCAGTRRVIGRCTAPSATEVKPAAARRVIATVARRRACDAPAGKGCGTWLNARGVCHHAALRKPLIDRDTDSEALARADQASLCWDRVLSLRPSYGETMSGPVPCAPQSATSGRYTPPRTDLGRATRPDESVRDPDTRFRARQPRHRHASQVTSVWPTTAVRGQPMNGCPTSTMRL